MSDDLYKEMRYLQALAFEEQGRMEEAVDLLDDLILRDITFRDVKTRREGLSHVKRAEADVKCGACGRP
ncbi:hypothetical protein HY634_00225, partial [Candidatus Uhrbacteria bacterium]|nr:hypothetical protein [Candidatus Uhrbacteria bacterium]